jgi:DNA gyrase subunit A
LGEVVDGCVAYIDNPAIAIEDLIHHIPGPDFPTGGVILGKSGIREAFHLGRGSIPVRARSHIEEIRKDREAIVVSEIPYQVNKARLLERIAECVREKIIEGISDLRDESDRDGVRVVIELKREAMAEVVLNQLYRHTPLQTSFGVNMLAINGGRPELLNLKQIIAAFVTFREEVITRRAVFDLRKTRERAHILVGLAIAVANIDEVIDLIRKAPDPNTARDQLMARAWPAQDVAPLIKLIDEPGRTVAEDGTYRLSEEQAKAILELRLQRLTGLEREKIAEEIKEIAAAIVDLLDILESRARRLTILRTELLEIKEQFATPRRTTLEELEFEQDVEDLIQREEMVVTVTHGGYIKRVPLSAFRAQRRGGKGRAAMATRDEDFVTQLFVADTHTPMLLFSTRGMVYKTKVYKLPLGTPQSRGRALVNLLPLEEGETISTVMPLPEDETRWNDMFVMFATSSGNIRRNRLSDFTNVMANGKIAMKLEEKDEQLVGVQTCTETDDVLLAARGGRSIRFAVGDVRVFSSRTSTGVRGISLGEGDRVVSMSVLAHVEADTAEREAYLRWSNARRRLMGEEADVGAPEPAAAEDADSAPGSTETVELPPERLQAMEAAEEFILTVTENGYGKRSSAYEYRITGRGGKGIVNIATNERNGAVAATFPVGHGDQIMLVSDRGQLIRCPVADIRIAGRNTQGVIVFKVDEGERVVSVTRLGELGETPENGAEAAGANGADEAAPDAANGGTGDAETGEAGAAVEE